MELLEGKTNTNLHVQMLNLQLVDTISDSQTLIFYLCRGNLIKTETQLLRAPACVLYI